MTPQMSPNNTNITATTEFVHQTKTRYPEKNYPKIQNERKLRGYFSFVKTLPRMCAVFPLNIVRGVIVCISINRQISYFQIYNDGHHEIPQKTNLGCATQWGIPQGGCKMLTRSSREPMRVFVVFRIPNRVCSLLGSRQFRSNSRFPTVVTSTTVVLSLLRQL